MTSIPFLSNLPYDYSIEFVPYSNLTIPEMRNDFLRFCRWVDIQHGNQFHTTDAYESVKAFNQHPLMVGSILSICRFIVLKQNGKKVCVATWVKGESITTITTALDERHKGHATFLMLRLHDWFAQERICVVCPTEQHILTLLADAGWTPNDKFLNKDGTINTMPQFVKRIYASCSRGGHCLRGLNSHQASRMIWFMENLPNSPIPEC